MDAFVLKNNGSLSRRLSFISACKGSGVMVQMKRSWQMLEGTSFAQ
ncbi:hypothetical protein HCEG_08587 [Histoplasma capsulatum var. duboisii H88]|uniref:Uncharacterized protein n=1 Tax=Ajellomyces capsulatus (strain H88) TaxID=544711 RepID=F0UTZ5_AJEC8|nr:hypothetical protein HCEG_08587 [Histoplasma capsulatum var. duboisii H88]